jgi:CubicO group peptidase (beta-lactamase class C family)
VSIHRIVVALVIFRFLLNEGCKNESEDTAPGTDSDTASSIDTTSDSGASDDTDPGDDSDSDEPPATGMVDFLGDTDYPDDFWQTATPDEVGLDPVLLGQAVDDINTAGWEIHSFLITRNGRLVFEWYGYNTGTTQGDIQTPHQTVPSERHQIWSSTKSITSTLLGIAIDRGMISGIDATAASFFDDYETLNPSSEKSSITLEDLLTMRSGLEFTEGEEEALFASADPARTAFSRPVVGSVGEDWSYSSGDAEIITEILRTVTGRTPLEFANETLFGPLGIIDPPWTAGSSGLNNGGFGLSLTSREMARFGELYRNAGQWNGEQIVSAEWTDASTLPRCPTPWGRPYGYFWWIPNPPGFINTVGAWGQEIFISRDNELVVVFTANLPNETADSIFTGLINDYVLPALR